MVTDALIDRCVRGDAKGQLVLYRTLHPLMMSICTRYQRNRQDAIAVMNQGFLKILRNLGKRPAHIPFEAWARRIMINTVIDAFRKERPRREREVLDAPIDDHASSEVNEYLHDMEAEAFAHLVQVLPPMSRQVFNLFVIDDHSHAQIADLLGISEGTSKWHVSQARGILRRALAKQAGARTLNTPLR